MDIEKFKTKRKSLYHLTDSRNLDNIVNTRKIYSAMALVKLSDCQDVEKNTLINDRRTEHNTINIKGKSVHVRDQKPISLKALKKCLTNGWSVSQYLQHLNMRVFFWPTISRLERHFNRYKKEKPIIIKINSEDLFLKNPNVEFCRLNSGATRANSFLNGLAPSRGIDTFQSATNYKRNVSSVAEVTIPYECTLPDKIWTSRSPKGLWKEINL